MSTLADWIDLADFFYMGGHGLYVWGSLGMCAAALGAEVLALRLRRHALAKTPVLPDPADAGAHEAVR
ncbi:MAG: heme exporter protein CcmD [Hydrogenophaga sp.]|nr:heme exporter protein CcmD [Hydrogenophaga sp.]